MVFALGRQEQVWLKQESSFDSVPGDDSTPAFSATDALAVLSLSVEPTLELKVRDDKRDSNSAQEAIALRKDGSWSLRSRMVPSGSAGVAPDSHPAFTTAYGTGVASGSTVTYSLAKNKTSSLSIHRKVGLFAELLTGCTVDAVSVTAKGDDMAELEFSGKFADLIRTAQTSVPDGATASATSFDVTNGDCLQLGSLITVGSEDIKINTMSGDTITSCTRAWHGTSAAVIASGATASPYAPSSQTVAGSPSVGINGSLTIDGVSHKVISFDHKVLNELSHHNDHFGSNKTDGFSDAKLRQVTFNLEARVTADLVGVLNLGSTVTAVDIVCVLGTGTGKIWTFNYPNAIGKVVALEVPEFEEATVKFEFTAYKNASDEDEHSLTIT